jgi:hypothetical protein
MFRFVIEPAGFRHDVSKIRLKPDTSDVDVPGPGDAGQPVRYAEAGHNDKGSQGYKLKQGFSFVSIVSFVSIAS